jgi:hypothetical protein
MIQQGQVFKLTVRGADGRPLWAYRYRLEGRGSVRPQVGGFATRTEALKALENVLGNASGGACDDGQAALAARKGHHNLRGGQGLGSLAKGRVRVAPVYPGRAPL